MKCLFAAAAAGTLLLPCGALADPGLADEVYGPTVHRGQTEIELRGGVLQGPAVGGDWQFKAEASHAFTDWWRPGLVAEWEQEDGPAEFTALAFENKFDITATRDWPVHFGGYVEYSWEAHGADELELKVLMRRARGPWKLTLNLIGEREFGAEAREEWEFGYAAEAAYALTDEVKLGVQGFGDAGAEDSLGDLGDQAHYWGPFTQFELCHVGDGEIELQLGYLIGAGETEADGQFRFKIEYEFGGSY